VTLPTFDCMTLKFSRVLEVVEVHMRAKFHQAKCSGSHQAGSSRQVQEIWANAHETCDSIGLISYAGCLSVSKVIVAKIHSLNARRNRKSQKITKYRYVGYFFLFQSRSKSSMLVPPGTDDTASLCLSGTALTLDELTVVK